MQEQRGKILSAGMAGIPLGTRVVDIKGAYEALTVAGFDGQDKHETGRDCITNVLSQDKLIRPLAA